MNQPMTHTKVTTPAMPSAATSSGELRKRMLMYGGIAVAVVLVGWVGYRYWSRKPVPRLNAKIEEIVRYVEDAGFRDLSIDRQFVYLKALEERKDETKAAFEKKLISADEYAAAKTYAWFGKQLSHMEAYVAKRSPIDRQKYLDKLIDKKLKDEMTKKTDPKATTGADDGDDLEPPVARDESLEKVLPLTWPRETRAQWEQYRKALRDREKERLASTAGWATTKKSGN